jgi:hypothetical protein
MVQCVTLGVCTGFWEDQGSWGDTPTPAGLRRYVSKNLGRRLTLALLNSDCSTFAI